MGEKAPCELGGNCPNRINCESMGALISCRDRVESVPYAPSGHPLEWKMLCSRWA